jgi:hypothetical protein
MARQRGGSGGATSCLELSPTPFSPCLIAMSRCSAEWKVVPLKSFRPDQAVAAFPAPFSPAEMPDAP